MTSKSETKRQGAKNPNPHCQDCKGKGWLQTTYGWPVKCPRCYPVRQRGTEGKA